MSDKNNCGIECVDTDSFIICLKNVYLLLKICNEFCDFSVMAVQDDCLSESRIPG